MRQIRQLPSSIGAVSGADDDGGLAQQISAMVLRVVTGGDTGCKPEDWGSIQLRNT